MHFAMRPTAFVHSSFHCSQKDTDFNNVIVGLVEKQHNLTSGVRGKEQVYFAVFALCYLHYNVPYDDCIRTCRNFIESVFSWTFTIRTTKRSIYDMSRGYEVLDMGILIKSSICGLKQTPACRSLFSPRSLNE